MGLPVDFLDVGIFGQINRVKNRPKNWNQPNSAKDDLFHSEVSRVKVSFGTE
jgi:hypothetical protein